MIHVPICFEISPEKESIPCLSYWSPNHCSIIQLCSYMFLAAVAKLYFLFQTFDLLRNILKWDIATVALVGWLCWGLTSQSTIFQSYRDGAIASWVINQYFRGVKCLAQGHNTAVVGLEPRTSRSGVQHSTTEPPRSPATVAVCLILQGVIVPVGTINAISLNFYCYLVANSKILLTQKFHCWLFLHEK